MDKKEVIISAGLIIVKNKKILLAKPTVPNSVGHYSIPKGIVEEGETYKQAAIRETFEEIGIKIPIELLNKTERVVTYSNNGVITKRVFCYIVNLNEDYHIPEVIPKKWLQSSEIEYAAFFSLSEAFNLLFWRFRHLLFELDLG